MKLRLDADTIGQLLRLALERRGYAVADVPVELRARGGGFEAEVEVAHAAPRGLPRSVP